MTSASRGFCLLSSLRSMRLDIHTDLENSQPANLSQQVFLKGHLTSIVYSLVCHIKSLNHSGKDQAVPQSPSHGDLVMLISHHPSLNAAYSLFH